MSDSHAALPKLRRALDEVTQGQGEVDPDQLLEAFLGYVDDAGISLYPAQEEAVLEIFAGKNVILNTPTGSGKSLVALAAHFYAVAMGQRTFYTAPIKALVSEKFFALCKDFGADYVGMMTGDASVNRDAPIVCCTAEILSNLALREGEKAAVDQVVMDEFHYYSDRDRGVAWQVPLLTLPQSKFLLMSATLGETAFFVRELTQLTGTETALVKSTDRPVPLDYQYVEKPLLETIMSLLNEGKTPVYIVHFTQRSATERAQALMSIDFLDKTQKATIKEELKGFRFDSPSGKELKRFISHGIGVHHAGLLPKYRLLVERLAQKGLLKLICGTDTLGVGVNVPIRTVVFTQLCKFDGEKTRILTVRDFKQIAGRAGRKGFDDQGTVVAQAPEHVVENKAAESRAAGDPKKLRKLVRKKPPDKGYVHFDEATFQKLIDSDPEPLSSSFVMSHGMLLQLLDRPGDGCLAVKSLIRQSHESRKKKFQHGRTAIALLRSLIEAGVVELLSEGDSSGRKVRINLDLQEDFALNQPLALYTISALETLRAQKDAMDETEYALCVISIVEATLESPRVVLLKQLDKIKTQVINELKEDGVEYEQRMEELEKLEWPKPLAEFIYETFNAFAERQPWVGAENIRPKSIARDMYEQGMNFNEYVNEYGLSRSEGVLLRYLSDAYKATMQTVPEDDKTDALFDFTDWLSAVIRQVDSSLLDEWERMKDPAAFAEKEASRAEDEAKAEPPDITRNPKAFDALIRNELFRAVRMLARRDYEAFVEHPLCRESEARMNVDEVAETLAPFFDEYPLMMVDAHARSPKNAQIVREDGRISVTQTLCDPEGDGDWFMSVEVDEAASREAQTPVMRLVSIGQL